MHSYMDGTLAVKEIIDSGKIGIPYTHITMDQLSFFRSMEMPVTLWTINDFEDQKRYFREDLLNIATRSVRTALVARSEAN